MKKKQKILILLDWFYPGFKAGGPIQSCVNLSLALKNDFDVYVLTTDTDHGVDEPYPNIITGQWDPHQLAGINIKYLVKKELTVKQVQAEIKNLAPDFIYLNLLFSPVFALYPLWLKFTGKLQAKVLLCPRGTLYDSALAVKPLKKKIVLGLLKFINIQKYITFHATNQRESIAIKKYFPRSKIIIADNLPNLNQQDFKVVEKIENTLKCIFVARIVPIKNLLFLLRILKNVSYSVELNILGPIEDNSYWVECEKVISELPSNINVVYVGAKRNDELIEILQQQHLFVLPTEGENFGHAIFESFLAGRPVLISDQTPWLNLEQLNVGWDVSLKDENKFVEYIEKAAQWDQKDFLLHAKASWEFANRFINDPLLKEKYFNLFHETNS